MEGQADVLRFHDAGIKNCVGIFGCVLKEAQSILLEATSVDNIVLCLDKDRAGKQGQDKIFKNYSDLFNIKTVDFDTKDIGELTVEQIKQQIVPQIEKYIKWEI